MTDANSKTYEVKMIDGYSFSSTKPHPLGNNVYKFKLKNGEIISLYAEEYVMDIKSINRADAERYFGKEN